MLTMEDSNHSVSTGCCTAVNGSGCPEADWSRCLVQQGFLPNLFSLHEAGNNEAKMTARESKGNLPATLLSPTLSIFLPLVLCVWILSGTLVRSRIRGTVRKFLLLHS